MQNYNTYITSYTSPYSATEIIFFLQIIFTICDALRDFVPFVQFEKRKKHTWRKVTFSTGFYMRATLAFNGLR